MSSDSLTLSTTNGGQVTRRGGLDIEFCSESPQNMVNFAKKMLYTMFNGRVQIGYSWVICELEHGFWFELRGTVTVTAQLLITVFVNTADATASHGDLRSLIESSAYAHSSAPHGSSLPYGVSFQGTNQPEISQEHLDYRLKRPHAAAAVASGGTTPVVALARPPDARFLSPDKVIAVSSRRNPNAYNYEVQRPAHRQFGTIASALCRASALRLGGADKVSVRAALPHPRDGRDSVEFRPRFSS
ncbi:hypothetical protein DFH06DRAFT_1295802 [Mycena polygramma]|nr:hypothetical protein DFH06DRAFT_1295802 [Mycena polygramma]